jgi:hypothetical protein
MRLLELNLKKLAVNADQALALREYTPMEGGAYSARIKGLINETRANKYAYNDHRINESYFTSKPDNYH